MSSAAAGGGALRDGTPVRVLETDSEPRCEHEHPRQPGKPCGALLARLATRPWAIDCKRCGNRTERT